MVTGRFPGYVPAENETPSVYPRLDEVRDIVCTIAPGRVLSYGDIGVVLGLSPRQVGRAMSLIAIQGVPWWRVVYSDGTPARCHDGQAPHLLGQDRTPMRGARVDMQRARQSLQL